MLIDRTHRTWIQATAAAFVVSLVLYFVYMQRVALPSGGSAAGIAFGIAGFALMLYAALLGVRKKFPVWRFGRAQTWMRGHLWLGTLSFPLTLFHAGFTFGGGLAFVLMWLFVVVIASGWFGAYLQHTMPRRLMREVPMETIYDQIDHVRAQLLAEADTVVAEACGKLEIETVAPAAAGVGAGTELMAREGMAALASTARIDAEASSPLREFYAREMRPFLSVPAGQAGHPLADPAQSALRFEKVRALVPAAFHAAIADLENICEEERQLARQRRLHRMLHAWQLVHVPLSIALLVLAVVHIVVALRY
ncbi:MAG TPA: LPXTG cell wall anchor domain-containing protein [Vicinamibacterales bacterium]|nr:LPXTG cell wall anchor domain-containing protein [Vicinamibacterales bacterium]